jgi:hypothetical protein
LLPTVLCETEVVPLRAAGVCGLLAFATLIVGWVAGDLAQPEAYSSANDDTSDLGAMTANAAWVYNQIGGNLTGILVVLFGLGLWRALSPDFVGRIGAGAVMLTGLGVFFDGVFRLDCRGIDRGCTNDSWHASAHKMETRITVVAIFLAPLILAFAFRRAARWRDAWLPTIAAVPAAIVIGVVFSAVGDGAAVRATTATWFAWVAFVSVRLIRATTPHHAHTA